MQELEISGNIHESNQASNQTQHSFLVDCVVNSKVTKHKYIRYLIQN